jgi:hypothetical protein
MLAKQPTATGAICEAPTCLATASRVVAGGICDQVRPRTSSTTRRWPVAKPAASETKKLTASAMSAEARFGG